MKKLHFFAAIIGIIVMSMAFYSCEKNASGRNTLSLVDDGTVMTMAQEQYTAFLNENPPVTGTPEADKVARVSTRVIGGVQQYLSDIGQSGLVSGYQWEFNLINNEQANAWCMPGGKIVVYSGILPLTATDDELAVVVGHEIAHAVLKHGNERLSQQLLASYGGAALSTLMSQNPSDAQQLFAAAFGVGSTLGTLAFSRKQETESDEAGLYYMAYAKYNPNAAVTFWEKMQQQSTANPPEILSTHPSDDTRIADIKTFLPKAMEYYNKQQ
ncbi:MAG: M48 family peptidase [Sphingobacteriales bacterium]|nr:MAG: M48 family peptidase [Sphingobacteriales bacterium]